MPVTPDAGGTAVTQDSQTFAIQSPQDTKAGRMVNLSGKSTRLWRKQILPLGTINYEGRQIQFDRKYHRDLVRSFRDGAYGQVPFQLADATNTHTNDPDRTRGDLVDLRAESDGLYGYFELADPAVVLNNKKLGVSCRILENYTREHDGKQFGRALQHVLGTLDPRITGMKPWESVELSAPDSTAYTVDLSSNFYIEPPIKDGAEMADATEDKHVVELSTAQLERLNALLEQDETDQQVIEGLNPEDFEGDDEVDDGEETEGAEQDENLDDDGANDSVALAQLRDLQRQVIELNNRNADQAIAFEVEQLAATGLAPSVIEAARPLLALGS